MAEIVEKFTKRAGLVRFKTLLRHPNAILVGVLVIMISAIAIMSRGVSASPANVKNILVQSSTRGVASIGQTFVILTAGIDLSVGGVACIAALLGASLLTTELSHNIVGYPVGLSIAIPVMLLLGLGIGAANGSAVSRIGMPALIVTLAMWEMTKGAGYNISRGYTIMALPHALGFFGTGAIAGVPVPIIIFIGVAVVAYFALYHTSFGRSVYAVGGNPTSSWLSGINVKRILFSVYLISGFLAALGGLISMSRSMVAGMMTATGLELDAIAAVCVGGISLFGGRGTLIGAIIGVMIIGVINNGMDMIGLAPALRALVKGGVIFAAVAADVLRRR